MVFEFEQEKRLGMAWLPVQMHRGAVWVAEQQSIRVGFAVRLCSARNAFFAVLKMSVDRETAHYRAEHAYFLFH